MPIYEYECLACKARFERSQRFSDPPLTECPECSGAMRRVLFPAGVVFKGSGWYITDSRKAPPGETAAGSSDAKPDAKSNGKPAGTSSTKGESGVTASTAKAG